MQEQPAAILPRRGTRDERRRDGQHVRAGHPQPFNPIVERWLAGTIESAAGVRRDLFEIIEQPDVDRGLDVPCRGGGHASGRGLIIRRALASAR
jgi:hypothetical protein